MWFSSAENTTHRGNMTGGRKTVKHWNDAGHAHALTISCHRDLSLLTRARSRRGRSMPRQTLANSSVKVGNRIARFGHVVASGGAISVTLSDGRELKARWVGPGEVAHSLGLTNAILGMAKDKLSRTYVALATDQTRAG